MQKEKIIWFLKAPLILTVICSLGASIYAVYNKIFDINIATPIFFIIILMLYFWGEYLQLKKVSKKAKF